MKSTLSVLALFIGVFCCGQSYKFRQYSEQDGLNNKFVYSLEQDLLGHLLVGTGEGLYRFDGFKFKQYTTANGLADDFITCSMTDADGSIWYGHGNGSVSKYSNNVFEKIDMSRLTISRINDLFQDHEKIIWAVTQNDGLLQLQQDGSWKKIEKGIEDITLYSFCSDRQSRIWLGTDMGLLTATINKTDEVQYEFLDEIIETKVSSLLTIDDNLFVGTEDAGLFHIDLNDNDYSIHTVLFDSTDFVKYNINQLFFDTEKNLFVSTNNSGLLKLSTFVNEQFLQMIDYSTNEIQNSNSIRTCLVDREGNTWIGSIGDGLIKLEDDYFSIYAKGKLETEAPIHSIFEKGDTIWYGGIGQVVKALNLPDNILTTYDVSYGLPLSEIKAIYTDENGALWIGTNDYGLFRLEAGDKKFRPIEIAEDLLNKKINDIVGFNNIVYVATDFGVYQLNNGKVISHLSIQSGLTHNVVKSLFRDSKGRIWIGTHDSQITYIEDGIIKSIETPLKDAMLETKCIAEDNNGDIWIGTEGTGVFKVSATEAVVFDKRNGLYSDYCYSLTCDNRNNLWIGHRGALSRVNMLTNKVDVIDPSKSFEYAFLDNSVDKFSNGTLIFGTSNGLMRYEPDKDFKNEVEPILHFEGIIISDSSYHFNQAIVLKSGEYKLEIDFIGISLKNSKEVTYQYILEGYDSDWTEPTNESFASYNKLTSGNYTFKVRTYNSDGFGGQTEASFTIFIDLPFWQKWWFILMAVLIIVMLVRYIFMRRERMLKSDQEFLQKALDDATHNVMEQKELLEVKNKDITDSIQYARNIQKAMLPSHESLRDCFADAFVYFKPRDIVSGDFFWIDKFENDIVVSCADCTGHGVPGAFMSLIGITLLKEVSRDKSVQCARDVLVRLDDDLRQLLNRHGSEFGVEDGMDICVFNYNISTKKIMVSSANRPIVLRIDGEWIEVKGDRQSVGGSNTSFRKEFVQHEFKVNSGDLIYMFSDGITDQFGGQDGKKLKRSGLLKILKESAHLPMDQQRVMLRDQFYLRKGDHPQIDDIIVMGIEF